MNVRDPDANQRTQAELYGASVGDLAGTVRGATGLSQSALAKVLGLSAPMLSQLVSGQRIKISNPAAVARLDALMALSRRADLDPSGMAEEIERISEVQPTLTGIRRSSDGHEERAQTLALLSSVAQRGELHRAADALSEGSALRTLLEEAARGGRP